VDVGVDVAVGSLRVRARALQKIDPQFLSKRHQISKVKSKIAVEFPLDSTSKILMMSTNSEPHMPHMDHS
jgi:hypothetical protein